ncbi:MAG TPA: hypothetical protein VMS60_00020 [Solirubrobacterales bacterium]|nr:hypothetical protein [Solirubrobacterales bacterium]
MAPRAQSHPSLDDARDLLEWQPPLGVLSVYVRIDPADRRGGWRTALRNGLADAVREKPADHEARVALRSTADRIARRFGDQELSSLPRGELGFVEVGREPGRERWWSTHLAPCEAANVYLEERPVLVPFLRLAARCRPRGIALVSAERVRLQQWEPGHLEELKSWEMAALPSDEGREHERNEERLAENRHRFLCECGRLSAKIAADRSWRDVIAFSAPQCVEHFRRGFPDASPELVRGGDVDLIAEPAGRFLQLVETAVERRDAELERRLVDRALEETRGGAHAVAGAQEAAAALEQGRVEHLIVDDATEPLIRRALSTGARITPVSGAAAEGLAPAEGVAALLRY